MLSNLKLKTRLGLAFGATAFLLIVIAGTGLFLMRGLQNNTKDLATNWIPSITTLGTIKTEVATLRRVTLRYVLEPRPEARKELASQRMAVLTDRLPKAQKVYEPLISSPEEIGRAHV